MDFQVQLDASGQSFGGHDQPGQRENHATAQAMMASPWGQKTQTNILSDRKRARQSI